MRNLRLLSTLCAVSVAFVLAGCGDDTTGAGGAGGDSTDGPTATTAVGTSSNASTASSSSHASSSVASTGSGTPECGDGHVDAGEQCDDGAANSDTGACTSTCQSATCGDSLVQAGVEDCDQGAANSDTGACTSTCHEAVCGDGLVQTGVEGCDDGNTVNDDDCTNTCALASCGDGVVQPGEACDDGAANSNTGDCNTACQLPTCGDGFVHTGSAEQCDNGAANNNTGACTLACVNATCGDGFVHSGVETCDDGNAVQGDGCNVDCTPSGGVTWTQTYLGAANLADAWYGVVTDSAGGVYVTGIEGTGAQGYDLVVRKYNAAGAVQWTGQYNGTGNGSDGGAAIALDPAGNPVVVGWTTVTTGDTDIFVRKYNASTGSVLWTQTIQGGAPTEGNDSGTGIAIAPSGNLYISAQAVTDNAQGADAVVAKLSPTDGSIIWADIQNGAGNMDDAANGVAVDTTGAVFAVGGLRTTANYDTWVRKYADAGTAFTLTWNRTFNGGANGDDLAYAVAVDPTTNSVVAAGIEGVSGSTSNIWIRKYDGAGNTTWTQTYAGAANLNDAAYGVDIDATGAVVATGFEAVANSTADVWVRRYTSAGVPQWTRNYNGAADEDDIGNAVTFDASGNVLVAGYDTAVGPNNDAWVRKYTP